MDIKSFFTILYIFTITVSHKTIASIIISTSFKKQITTEWLILFWLKIAT